MYIGPYGGARPRSALDHSKRSELHTTKVFVWGLNDKDQLGGLKGSKIKLPIYSDTLSNLKPIHIAGMFKNTTYLVLKFIVCSNAYS